MNRTFTSSTSFYSTSCPSCSDDDSSSFNKKGALEEDDNASNNSRDKRFAFSEPVDDNYCLLATTDNEHQPPPLTTNAAEIISRIESLVMDTYKGLSSLNGQRPRLPRLSYHNLSGHPTTKDLANTSQSRSVCNIFLILQLVHGLLLHGSKETNRTAQSKGLYAHRSTITTRQIYYYYVTHFKSQKECDDSISDVCKLLRVPRIALGIVASPKGWLCGALQIQVYSNVSADITSSMDKHVTILDGIGALNMSDGLPISSHWIDYLHSLVKSESLATVPEILPVFSLRHHPTVGPAKMIVVVEKETVYHRLVEELNNGFSNSIVQKCIFITGKGYPDVATRACLSSICQAYPKLPVVGFCDCNPFGVHVLHTYISGGSADTLNWEERDMLATPRLEWIGLYPSQLSSLQEELPRNAFQQMTARDLAKLNTLLDLFDEVAVDADNNEELKSTHTVLLQELRLMQQLGYKAELEALHWLGMDYLLEWMKETLNKYLDEWERRTFQPV